jgi:hypothetical protein
LSAERGQERAGMNLEKIPETDIQRLRDMLKQAFSDAKNTQFAVDAFNTLIPNHPQTIPDTLMPKEAS